MKRTKFDIDCVTELLKKNLEFENMPKPRLQQIAKVLYYYQNMLLQRATYASFKNNQYVFKIHQPTDYLGYIIKGTLAVTMPKGDDVVLIFLYIKQGEVTINVLHNYDTFGANSLMDNKFTRSANLLAKDDTEILKIDTSLFRSTNLKDWFFKIQDYKVGWLKKIGIFDVFLYLYLLYIEFIIKRIKSNGWSFCIKKI